VDLLQTREGVGSNQAETSPARIRTILRHLTLPGDLR
jgi:hypothetical protein